MFLKYFIGSIIHGALCLPYSIMYSIFGAFAACINLFICSVGTISSFNDFMNSIGQIIYLIRSIDGQ